MRRIPVFWTERNGRVEVLLRRWVEGSQGQCPVNGFHTNFHPIGQEPEVGQTATILAPDHPWRDDPRWPDACDCGREFGPDDPRQMYYESIYVCPATGQTWWQRQLPAGAMYDSPWYPWKGADGISLTVVCPPDGAHNTWQVDGPARKDGEETHPAPAWQRTGDPRAHPPVIDVTPSIEIGFTVDENGKHVAGGPNYYHGHLRHGALED
jgi:hypothetical protein